jgi:hypothetical protein
MKKLLIGGVAAAAVTLSMAAAPIAQAAQGDQCYNWHATMQDSTGQTLTCTHLADSGHMMYWEYGGAQDIGFTGGFKIDTNNPYGHNGPCNSNDV